MKKKQLLLQPFASFLKLLFLVTLFILSSNSNPVFCQNWNEVIKMAASDRGSLDQFGYSVDISGNFAIVGAPYESEDTTGRNTLTHAGSAYILKNIAGKWTEVQKLVALDRSYDDGFGYSVAISGSYAIVSAVWEDEDTAGGNYVFRAGSVYIFKNNSGTWFEVQKLVASKRSSEDNFGSSVAISGDYLIVGAYYEDEDSLEGNTLASAGSAYIFKNSTGTWSQVKKLVASDREAGDQFGISVAISGDYAIIGSSFEDDDTTGGNSLISSGSVYVFKNNSGSWSEVQKLVASDRGAGDRFGCSVAISRNYVIVGASSDKIDSLNSFNWAGAAYLFKNNTGTWLEVQKLMASDRGARDNFGISVAISEDYAIVGASFEDEDTSGANTLAEAGSAYIFKNNEGTWNEEQKIVASDREADDYFGSSVGISEDYAILGAHLEDEDTLSGNTHNDAGSVYFFKNCATTETDVQTACNSFNWIDGNTYTESNDKAKYILTNSSGCDSIISLDLTIIKADTSVLQLGDTLVAVSTTGTYQWLDCNDDYQIINGATSRQFIPSESGSYALQISENACTDTSSCIVLTVGIIKNNFGHRLKVYPNPTKGNFSVDLGATYKKPQVLITDITGRLIESRSITQSRILDLSIDAPAGIYLVSIQAGNKRAVIRLIKE